MSDKIEEVATEIYRDLDLDGQEDYDRVTTILLKHFPASEPSPAESKPKVPMAMIEGAYFLGRKNENIDIRAHIARYGFEVSDTEGKEEGE